MASGVCATESASYIIILQVAPGSRIQLGRVLALKQGGQFSVGQPYVEGATVEAEVLEELKGPKVRQRMLFTVVSLPLECCCVCREATWLLARSGALAGGLQACGCLCHRVPLC